MSDILHMSSRDRADGTRYVMRRHTWGFSETTLRMRIVNGKFRWDTISHVEHRLPAPDLKAVLKQARDALQAANDHLDFCGWDASGERVCAALAAADEALK